MHCSVIEHGMISLKCSDCQTEERSEDDFLVQFKAQSHPTSV